MWFALLACQAPFGTDRHDLVGFRLAAVSVPPAFATETVTPEVALVVDGRPWSDDPVELVWYWVETEDDVLAIDPLTPVAGSGPAPSLLVPSRERVLAVVATHDGREQRAFVELPEPPGLLDAPFDVLAEGLPLTVDAAEGPELVLDARAALEPTALAEIAPGDFVRLTADVDGDPLVRWMATAGTFFELERQVADWAAGELRLDVDEIDDGRTVLDPGPVTVLALALGVPGETRFAALDLSVGPHPPGVVVQGRAVPTVPAVDPQPGDGVAGTFVADDTSPTGFRLEGATLVDLLTVDFGSDAIPCAANLVGPFDPRWLLTGVCTRADVDGRAVVLAPEGTW